MKTKDEMKTLVANYYLSLPVINDEALDEFMNELLNYFDGAPE
jgi:hypothetical protein